MKDKTKCPALLFCAVLPLFMLSGCLAEGSTVSGVSGIYMATMLLSFLMLTAYCSFIKKKDPWMLLLFACIFLTNFGYFFMSLSQNVEEALLANRISYLGSVFLLPAMLMIVVRGCGIKYRKWTNFVLVLVSSAVYYIAASPGYSDIYYKSVELQTVNGASVLKKEYGPWHKVYTIFLLTLFALMLAVLVYVYIKKKLRRNIQSVLLVAAVFGNIGVWLIERIADIGFELLSISYIFTELFLLGLYLMAQETELGRYHVPEIFGAAESTLKSLLISEEMGSEPAAKGEPKELSEEDKAFAASCEFFESQLNSLTPTEQIIYEHYLCGRSTKEILQMMSITENTLKFHNKNIYSKLGVSSRRQLLEIASALKKKK